MSNNSNNTNANKIWRPLRRNNRDVNHNEGTTSGSSSGDIRTIPSGASTPEFVRTPSQLTSSLSGSGFGNNNSICSSDTSTTSKPGGNSTVRQHLVALRSFPSAFINVGQYFQQNGITSSSSSSSSSGELSSSFDSPPLEQHEQERNNIIQNLATPRVNNRNTFKVHSPYKSNNRKTTTPTQWNYDSDLLLPRNCDMENSVTSMSWNPDTIATAELEDNNTTLQSLQLEIPPILGQQIITPPRALIRRITINRSAIGTTQSSTEWIVELKPTEHITEFKPSCNKNSDSSGNINSNSKTCDVQTDTTKIIKSSITSVVPSASSVDVEVCSESLDPLDYENEFKGIFGQHRTLSVADSTVEGGNYQSSQEGALFDVNSLTENSLTSSRQAEEGSQKRIFKSNSRHHQPPSSSAVAAIIEHNGSSDNSVIEASDMSYVLPSYLSVVEEKSQTTIVKVYTSHQSNATKSRDIVHGLHGKKATGIAYIRLNSLPEGNEMKDAPPITNITADGVRVRSLGQISYVRTDMVEKKSLSAMQFHQLNEVDSVSVPSFDFSVNPNLGDASTTTVQHGTDDITDDSSNVSATPLGHANLEEIDLPTSCLPHRRSNQVAPINIHRIDNSNISSKKIAAGRKYNRRRCCIVTFGFVLILILLAIAVGGVCFIKGCRVQMGNSEASEEDNIIDTGNNTDRGITTKSPTSSKGTLAPASPDGPSPETEKPELEALNETKGVEFQTMQPTIAPSKNEKVSTEDPAELETEERTTTKPPSVIASTVEPTVQIDGGNPSIPFTGVLTSTEELYDAVDEYLQGNSTLPPMDTWDVSRISNFNDVFSATRNPAASAFNEDLNQWTTSAAVSMERMFMGAAKFNGRITAWDVSKVTSMSEMFANANSFNGKIVAWNVGQVQNMYGMFKRASSFNSDISRWDTSKVTNMANLFWGAVTFNQDIGDWVTDLCEDMSGTFRSAVSFNQNLRWSTSKVKSMENMFMTATSFNGDLSSFDTSQTKSMSEMFAYAFSFEGNGLWSFHTTSVETMTRMFFAALSFHGEGLEAWNVQKVVDMSLMFTGASRFDQDLCPWRQQLIKLRQTELSTESMFYGTSCEQTEDPQLDNLFQSNFCAVCDETKSSKSEPIKLPKSVSSFTGAKFQNRIELQKAVDEYILDQSPSSDVASVHGWPIGNWDVELVCDFSYLFSAERNPEMFKFDFDLSGWNVSSATNMAAMFHSTVDFQNNGDSISDWDVSKVTNMSYMFDSSGFSGDISKWNVEKVRDFDFFAQFAYNFDSDLSRWNVKSAESMGEMFRGARSFESELTDWDVSNVIEFSSMFSGATSFRSNLCPWGALLNDNDNIEVRAMFAGTSCHDQNDPSSSRGHSWCRPCSGKL